LAQGTACLSVYSMLACSNSKCVCMHK
jgi:hypothetical protein